MKKLLGIILISAVLFSGNLVFAQEAAPVHVQQAEIQEIRETRVLTGKTLPFKSIMISAKIGGTVEKINVQVGDYIKKDQELIVLDQDNLKIQIKQAEAGVELARANLEMVQKGATKEELTQVETSYERAKASYEGAKKSLEIIKSIYNDKTSLRQQLSGAKTQLRNAEQQLEIAEEQFAQARITYEQVEKDYERMQSLYKEGAITRKELEGVETQYKNTASSLKTSELAKEQAQINYEGARENYSIAEELFEEPKSLEQQLDSARTQVEVAHANMEAAKANLDKVKKGAREEEIKSAAASLKQAEAGLEQAQLQYNNSVIRSPHQGLIASVNTEEGEMVGAGTPVINLVDLSQVYVQVDVNARTLTDINAGDRVFIDILPLDDGNREGKIANISPSINQQTQAYPVKILLNNGDQKIRGGMFADVEFVLKKEENAVIIPLAAVVSQEQDPYVFVLEQDKAVKRKIEIGIMNNEQVQVLKGIDSDEILITQGQDSLHDGDLVEVVE